MNNTPWWLGWIIVGAVIGWTAAPILNAADPITYLNSNGVAITTLFTIVLGFSTMGLWRATHQLWTAAEAQSEQTRNAAVASKNSADAAASAVALARETAEHQLRAYIAVSDFKVDIQQKGRKFAAEVRYTVANEGQTPARALFYETGIAIAPRNDTPEISLSLPVGPRDMLPRNLFVQRRRSLAFSEEVAEKIRSGRLRIFFTGRICYKCIYGTERTTRFHMRSNTRIGEDDLITMGAAQDGLSAT